MKHILFSIGKRRNIFLIFFTLVVSNIKAQDIQFSQFYEASTYLSPAFAGSAHNYRGIMHQRLQWPSLDAKYITSLFSFDNYFNDYRSGVGLMVLQDWQTVRDEAFGKGVGIKTTDISLQYAYELHLSSNLAVRPGLQLGYGTKFLDNSHMSIPEQWDQNGATGMPGLGMTGWRANYLNISSGTVFYTDRYFGGISIHNMNRPNQSFMNEVSRLPVKYSIISGYKIPLVHKKHMAYLEPETDISITPTIHYKFQGKADQVDLGMHANYDQAFAGLWYRGIPFKKYERTLHNHESVVVVLGYRYAGFSFSYSYDFSVSKLTNANPRGAHEINLTYIHYKHHKNNKPMKIMPCPTFYKKKKDKHHTETHHHDPHYKHDHHLPHGHPEKKKGKGKGKHPNLHHHTPSHHHHH